MAVHVHIGAVLTTRCVTQWSMCVGLLRCESLCAAAEPLRLLDDSDQSLNMQLMKGWEMGILRFLQARFMANEHWKTVEAAQKPRSSAHSGTEYVTKGNSLLARFEQAVKDTGIPVLIIHGEQDTLVPIGNSCRLAAVIHAPLIKISGCGHTPAEELPEMFVEEVSRFMKENILTEVAPDRRKRRPAK